MSLSQLKVFVQEVGHEAAEDMLICIGKAKTYALAKALIAKAMKTK